MATIKDQGPTVEAREVDFSRLEASLAKAEVAPRPNSREMKDVWRHAEKSDLDVDEFDFNFSLDSANYPLGHLRSLQEVFDAVQHETHLANYRNFSNETNIECFEATESRRGMTIHDVFFVWLTSRRMAQFG